MQNLLSNIGVINGAARGAGTTATTELTDVIDLANYEGVAGFCLVSTQAASGALAFHYQESETTAASDFVTVKSITGYNGAGKTLVIDVAKPLRRYARFKKNPTGTGGSPTGGVLVLPYGPRKSPVTQDTGEVGDSVIAISPTT